MPHKEAQGTLRGYPRGYGCENEKDKENEKENENWNEPDAVVRPVSIFSIPP
jgi:hypothetical protein